VLVAEVVDRDAVRALQQRIDDARNAFGAELDAIAGENLVGDAEVELPAVVVPQADVPERQRDPLIDSERGTWAEETLRLIQHKRYE
jgi:hypothetical protein